MICGFEGPLPSSNRKKVTGQGHELKSGLWRLIYNLYCNSSRITIGNISGGSCFNRLEQVFILASLLSLKASLNRSQKFLSMRFLEEMLMFFLSSWFYFILQIWGLWNNFPFLGSHYEICEGPSLAVQWLTSCSQCRRLGSIPD